MSGEDARILDRLYRTVLSRRGADPSSSYTAQLYAKGRPKIAQKVGEEAIETVIEAIRGDPHKLAQESADLLYHLLVLWADAGIEPGDVYRVLESRIGTGGLDEKASRSGQPPSQG